MAVEIESSEMAEKIVKQLEQKSLLIKELCDADFAAMRKALLIPEDVMHVSLETDLTDVDEGEVIEQAATSAVVNEIEESVEEVVLQEDADTRKEDINNFIVKSSKPYLNFIAGEQAESIMIRIVVTPEGIVDENSRQMVNEAAKRDIERILIKLIPAIGLDPRHVDRDTVISPFVHQSWSNTYRQVVSSNLGWQRFSNLGTALLGLEAAIFYAKPIAFDISTAGAASLATELLKHLNYGDFLSSRGLGVLLHTNDSIESGFQRKQLSAILGLQFVYSGHRLVRRFVQPFVEENLSYDDLETVKKDPKSVLQELAVQNEQPIKFDTYEVTGVQHAQTFQSFVIVGRRKFEPATGSSVKKAEMEAARIALSKLQAEPAYSELISAIYSPVSARKWSSYHISPKRYAQCISLAHSLGMEMRRSPVLLDLALTHRSYLGTNPASRSNLRLAFVGSYVISILLENYLIENLGWRADHADFKKDKLAEIHLNNTVIPAVFEKMNLIPSLQLGLGQKDISQAIKKDVIQAIFAVAFLWGGIDKARQLWTQWITPQLPEADNFEQHIPPTQKLQEMAQALSLPTPTYEYDALSGKSTIAGRCYIAGELLGVGNGQSKKEARSSAARNAIEVFKKRFDVDHVDKNKK